MKSSRRSTTSSPGSRETSILLTTGRWLRALGAFLLYANLFIGASAAALTYATAQLLGQSSPVEWIASAFVGCCTLIIYNLDRLAGGAEAEDAVESSARHAWIDTYDRFLWGLVAISAIAALWLGMKLPTRSWWLLAVMGLLAVGYAVPVPLPGVGSRRLKEVPGLKMVLIVVVWTGATVLLPAICIDSAVVSETWSVAGLRALFIFALTLPFDLRDAARDRAAGIRTIPHAIGKRRTRWLAVGTMAAFGGLAVAYFGLFDARAGLAHAATAVVGLPVVGFADVQRGEAYFVGVVDGMILVHAVVVSLLVG